MYDEFGRLDEKRYFDANNPPDEAPGDDFDFDELVDYAYDALGWTKEIKQDFDVPDGWH